MRTETNSLVNSTKAKKLSMDYETPAVNSNAC